MACAPENTLNLSGRYGGELRVELRTTQVLLVFCTREVDRTRGRRRFCSVCGASLPHSIMSDPLYRCIECNPFGSTELNLIKECVE
jgi:hypothetical protein